MSLTRLALPVDLNQEAGHAFRPLANPPASLSSQIGKALHNSCKAFDGKCAGANLAKEKKKKKKKKGGSGTRVVGGQEAKNPMPWTVSWLSTVPDVSSCV